MWRAPERDHLVEAAGRVGALGRAADHHGQAHVLEDRERMVREREVVDGGAVALDHELEMRRDHGLDREDREHGSADDR